jgi:flagellar hook assembly protein FlgD
MPYQLATDAPVNLRIYDIRGQLVRELNLGLQKAGSYRAQESAAYWDARDQFGEAVSSGMYFYTMQSGAFQATRRMLILK